MKGLYSRKQTSTDVSCITTKDCLFNREPSEKSDIRKTAERKYCTVSLATTI